MNLFITALLLGVAGFDPSGAIVIISALAVGAKKKDVCIFAITTFIGTVTVGVACSYLLGSSIEYIADWLNYIPDSIWLVLEFIVVGALFKWFVDRTFRKKEKEKKEESFLAKYIKKGLFAVGVFFAVTALTDPSFIAVITLSGHNMHFAEVLVANALWILISQSPIFILTIAVLLGKHESVIVFVQNKLKESRFVEKVKKVFPKLLTAIILIAALVLLADVISYCTTGNWLF